MAASCELTSLLHYLKEAIIYKIGAYHVETADENKFVGVHTAGTWHVSQPVSRTCEGQPQTQLRTVTWMHDSHMFLTRLFWRSKGELVEIVP